MQTFAIIPAAGRSQRMGQPKLLLPWGTRTVLEQVLAAWQASRVDHVVLVVHPDDTRIAELGRQAGAVVVQPAVAPSDMKASVSLGLEYIAAHFQPTDADAWLVAPADIPGLVTTTIDRLIAAYAASLAENAGVRSIWAPRAGERHGHPVLFPWPLAAEVKKLGAQDGMNGLVARNRLETIDLGEAGVLEDLDTPDDYERLRPRHGG